MKNSKNWDKWIETDQSTGNKQNVIVYGEIISFIAIQHQDGTEQYLGIFLEKY
jgi:hypothetical protein